MSLPSSSDDLRATLAALDARQRKIVGGMFALMIQNPERIREREWIVAGLTQVVLLSLEAVEDPGAAVESPMAAVEDVQRYAKEHADLLLNAAFSLFRQVGEDMAARAGGFAFEDAMAQALAYFVPDPGDAERKT